MALRIFMLINPSYIFQLRYGLSLTTNFRVIPSRLGTQEMNVVERVATFMLENQLTLVTSESCTAGLISATLADVPGAGSLLECALVTYSVEAKRRCLGASQSILSAHNLASEAVAHAMTLGAARNSSANVALARQPRHRTPTHARQRAISLALGFPVPLTRRQRWTFESHSCEHS